MSEREQERRGISAELQPILPGFYPDPTICRVDGRYVIANSSFEYFPGLPLHESQDLVRWSPVGNVLTRRSQFRRGDGRASAGIYGSTLRHHGGLFWCVTTNVSDFTGGQLLLTSTRPEGPWSEPVWIPDAIGIDPDICWDGDRCLLTWKVLDFVSEDGIWQAELDTTTGELTSPRQIWAGTGSDLAEGPHLYQIREHWYLLLAEGGTERGHRINVYRGQRPEGPFEASPRNPLLTHAGIDHAVQNIGHGDLIETPTGDWAMVYLGVRPTGSTPQFHTNGRETFVAGISWLDGWPIVDPDAFCVPIEERHWSDSFASPQLHHRWVVPGGEPESIAIRRTEGVSIETGVFGRDVLCARPTDPFWIARATVRDAGSFAVRIDERHEYQIIMSGGLVRATIRIGGISTVLAELEARGDIVLRIDAAPPGELPTPRGNAGPDEIVLGIEVEGLHHELARMDGRYLSTEVAGGFTGRMIALGGTAEGSHFLAVSYEALYASGPTPLLNPEDSRSELVR